MIKHQRTLLRIIMKAKAKPVVTFPLVIGFNKTITMDLKHWSDSAEVWFLHMTDHVTWCFMCS